MKRKLALLGHKVLREKAKEIKEITPEIKELAQDLIEIAKSASGVAAPQVCESVRMFAASFPKFDDKGNFIFNKEGRAEYEYPRIFINPKLSDPSMETEWCDEGCLSIPGIYMPIERPEAITIEYTDLEGQRRTERYESYIARILMHENDHLNGVLSIDRLSSNHKKEYLKEIQSIKKACNAKGLLTDP